jgi:hypothetical protein
VICSAGVPGIGAQFAAEPGVCQQLARRFDLVVGHQHAPRQDPERAFENAHVLVEHEMADAGTVEKGLDRGYEHRIVGPHDLFHSAPPSAIAGRSIA